MGRNATPGGQVRQDDRRMTNVLRGILSTMTGGWWSFAAAGAFWAIARPVGLASHAADRAIVVVTRRAPRRASGGGWQEARLLPCQRGQLLERKHSDVHALTSQKFFDKLIGHPKTEENYNFQVATGAQPLRQPTEIGRA
jgi:hypothetical protein